MNSWVDISTIIAATAGLWALAFAWLTYVASVRKQNRDEFLALKSIAKGLSVELELMKPWTGAGGAGYSKNMNLADAPPDWWLPGRIIWKFGADAVSSLPISPYLYMLGDIVGPFARLSFSISRLFQLYDEYRSFVNSDPAVALAQPVPTAAYSQTVLRFNHQIHVRMIGGEDSDDPACLYKAYEAATAALRTFEDGLAERALPLWFWIGHVVSAACFLAGLSLLVRLFCL